jgi:V8-like Glu-specific endopeptidase
LEFGGTVSALERVATEPEFDEGVALEAWYASYSSRASQSTTKTERRRGIVAEVVIGPDGRLRIEDTEDYPWRSICSLRITAGDGSPWIGTGWFIAPRTLITAGHCLYIHDRGGWVRSIEVIPGRDAAQMPYGSRRATRFRSTGGWVNGKKPQFDYGAILLSSGQEFDPYPGNLLVGVLSDAELQGQRINVAGYPGDKPTGTMWWHNDRISRVEASTIGYVTDTAGGQSGAAAYLKRGEERTAVGIHNYGASTGNSATRITSAVNANFNLWKSQA